MTTRLIDLSTTCSVHASSRGAGTGQAGAEGGGSGEGVTPDLSGHAVPIEELLPVETSYPPGRATPALPDTHTYEAPTSPSAAADTPRVNSLKPPARSPAGQVDGGSQAPDSQDQACQELTSENDDAEKAGSESLGTQDSEGEESASDESDSEVSKDSEELKDSDESGSDESGSEAAENREGGGKKAKPPPSALSMNLCYPPTRDAPSS